MNSTQTIAATAVHTRHQLDTTHYIAPDGDTMPHHMSAAVYIEYYGNRIAISTNRKHQMPHPNSLHSPHDSDDTADSQSTDESHHDPQPHRKNRSKWATENDKERVRTQARNLSGPSVSHNSEPAAAAKALVQVTVFVSTTIAALAAAAIANAKQQLQEGKVSQAKRKVR